MFEILVIQYDHYLLYNFCRVTYVSFVVFASKIFSNMDSSITWNIAYSNFFLSFFRESFNEFFYSFDSALNAFELGTSL